MLEYAVTDNDKDLLRKFSKDNDYMKDINLKNVSIEQAINGKVWNDIKESWTSDNKTTTL